MSTLFMQCFLSQNVSLSLTSVGDFEKTLQQLTELKADTADLKAKKDELTSENESLNTQIKVRQRGEWRVLKSR